MNKPPIGLVEAGGTKFILGIAEHGGEIIARHRLPTTTPQATLGAAMAWFRGQASTYRAIGFAAFGPLDLDRASKTYGCVRATTKPHWSGAAITGPFAAAFDCPVYLDTDVGAAALAEVTCSPEM